VTRPEPDKISSGVSRALALHDVTFLDLWETMMALEPAAAELAAQRRTEDDLAALSAAAAAFKTHSSNTPAAVAAVVEFFAAVAVASGNPVLSMSQAPLNELLAPILTRMIDAVSRTRIVIAQSAILEAITRRRREEARAWMEKHIRDFKRGYEVAGIPLGYSVPV
jgi:GntR family transcriptional regulator, transcriptional repressor for pyruvate dehydrogenase complex